MIALWADLLSLATPRLAATPGHDKREIPGAGAATSLTLDLWLGVTAAEDAPFLRDLALQGYSVSQLDRPALLGFDATARVKPLELDDT